MDAVYNIRIQTNYLQRTAHIHKLFLIVNSLCTPYHRMAHPGITLKESLFVYFFREMLQVVLAI